MRSTVGYCAPRALTPRIARRGVAHGPGSGRKRRWSRRPRLAALLQAPRTCYEQRAEIQELLPMACALIRYRRLLVVLNLL